MGDFGGEFIYQDGCDHFAWDITCLNVTVFKSLKKS